MIDKLIIINEIKNDIERYKTKELTNLPKNPYYADKFHCSKKTISCVVQEGLSKEEKEYRKYNIMKDTAIETQTKHKTFFGYHLTKEQRQNNNQIAHISEEIVRYALERCGLKIVRILNSKQDNLGKWHSEINEVVSFPEIISSFK